MPWDYCISRSRSYEAPLNSEKSCRIQGQCPTHPALIVISICPSRAGEPLCTTNARIMPLACVDSLWFLPFYIPFFLPFRCGTIPPYCTWSHKCLATILTALSTDGATDKKKKKNLQLPIPFHLFMQVQYINAMYILLELVAFEVVLPALLIQLRQRSGIQDQIPRIFMPFHTIVCNINAMYWWPCRWSLLL